VKIRGIGKERKRKESKRSEKKIGNESAKKNKQTNKQTNKQNKTKNCTIKQLATLRTVVIKMLLKCDGLAFSSFLV